LNRYSGQRFLIPIIASLDGPRLLHTRAKLTIILLIFGTFIVHFECAHLSRPSPRFHTRLQTRTRCPSFPSSSRTRRRSKEGMDIFIRLWSAYGRLYMHSKSEPTVPLPTLGLFLLSHFPFFIIAFPDSISFPAHAPFAIFPRV